MSGKYICTYISVLGVYFELSQVIFGVCGYIRKCRELSKIFYNRRFYNDGLEYLCFYKEINYY